MPFKIELKNVTFAYEGGSPIVRSAGFSLRPGEVLSIVAPAGGGKSTLLKLCAGLLRPDEGSLSIEGKNFWELSTIEQNNIRRQMGFDFQETALIANMSVFNNLALPLRYHEEMKETEIANTVEGWLDRLGLTQYRDNLPAALSMGVRKRVSFIRTMLLDREFYFWDEPTQGEDKSFVETVATAIDKKRKQGVGAIVTTQSESFFKRVSNKVLVLNAGKVAYLGPLKDAAMPVDISVESMLRE